MKINSFSLSSIDYPGKISVILFTSNCNYNCPACHAKQILESKDLIKEEKFFDYLDSRKGWIDGVVFCGGEPTLQNDLAYFARKIKERGLAVKLDTNGSDPDVLSKLKGLIDYVAMDVKGPPLLYQKIIGRYSLNLKKSIEKSINIISQFPDYEFRTTIVPVIRENEEISFLTPEEIRQTAKLIYDCTGNNKHKYFLQPFVPRKGELIDSRLESLPETPKDLLEKGKEQAMKYLPKTKIRGQ